MIKYVRKVSKFLCFALDDRYNKKHLGQEIEATYSTKQTSSDKLTT
ncbi:hypothetical protein QE390_001861 [Siphonobacter sp. SORGH_AS 1065]|nr:hypothetical protein [Siphonobacter sp. SORGH_AS_1065]